MSDFLGQDQFFEVEIEHRTFSGVVHTELSIVIYKRMLYVTMRGKWFKPRAFAPTVPLCQ